MQYLACWVMMMHHNASKNLQITKYHQPETKSSLPAFGSIVNRRRQPSSGDTRVGSTWKRLAMAMWLVRLVIELGKPGRVESFAVRYSINGETRVNGQCDTHQEDRRCLRSIATDCAGFSVMRVLYDKIICNVIDLSLRGLYHARDQLWHVPVMYCIQHWQMLVGHCLMYSREPACYGSMGTTLNHDDDRSKNVTPMWRVMDRYQGCIGWF